MAMTFLYSSDGERCSTLSQNFLIISARSKRRISSTTAFAISTLSRRILSFSFLRFSFSSCCFLQSSFSASCALLCATTSFKNGITPLALSGHSSSFWVVMVLAGRWYESLYISMTNRPVGIFFGKSYMLAFDFLSREYLLYS